MISSVGGKKTITLVWDGNAWLFERGPGDLVPIAKVLVDDFENDGNPGEITLHLGNQASGDFDATVTSDRGSVSPTRPQTVEASMGNTPKWTLTLPTGHRGEASYSILPSGSANPGAGREAEGLGAIPPDPTINVTWSTGRGYP